MNKPRPINQSFSLKEKNGIVDDIKDIRFHMDVLNSETGELRDGVKDLVKELKETNKSAEERSWKLIQVQTDVEWLKKAYWVIFTTSTGAFITGMFNLVSRAQLK